MRDGVEGSRGCLLCDGWWELSGDGAWGLRGKKGSGGCAVMGSIGILRLRVRGETPNAPLRMTEFRQVECSEGASRGVRGSGVTQRAEKSM